MKKRMPPVTMAAWTDTRHAENARDFRSKETQRGAASLAVSGVTTLRDPRTTITGHTSLAAVRTGAICAFIAGTLS
jgi:hypothetical protein